MVEKEVLLRRVPKIRTVGATDSRAITIPAGAADALALEEGEEPQRIRVDTEERSISFTFE